MLRSLSYDRNLVQFYGACLEREHAMLVLEYMEGGDLYQAIQENSYPLDTGLLSWYQKGSTIALDIAKGLVFLHQNDVSPSRKLSTCSPSALGRLMVITPSMCSHGPCLSAQELLIMCELEGAADPKSAAIVPLPCCK